MTAAMPSPKATTRTTPQADWPAAIVPRRMSSAFADGTRPPARPRRTARPAPVEPATGTWRCVTPPWLCSRRSCAARGRCAGRACRAGAPWSCACSWSCSWVCAGFVRARAARQRRTSATSIQPPTTTIDTAAMIGRRADDDVGRNAAPPRRRPARARGSRPCARRTPRARDPARGAGPARPDEVGGHEGLAVARRQGVAGAERGRDEQAARASRG